ncbi:MAG: hypothetical protein Q7S70_02360 [bacterium]|nr:hypothetical protein [bacterium]
MLVWFSTIILVLIALGGWLFLKRDPERYIHRKESPINLFFRWGRFCHHVFKITIIALFMITIFSFYKYFLGASDIFSASAALVAGIVLTGGKELLDKRITLDDVIASVLGIVLGSLIILIF